ncbi:MAG TPA: MlaD family protein, partial [Mycobacterium sp.]
MDACMVGRVVRAGLAAAMAAVVMSVGSSCASESRRDAAYCAFMPDTVGLYVGNPVTQMGYPIGKVTSIHAGPSRVRVDFSLAGQRRIPSDVKAVIRSASILADRSLELVGNYAGGPQLERAGCISLSRSVSPKSLSEVIGSADTFVNAINASGSTNVADTIRGADRLSHGNGAGVGHLLTLSSALLDSPDQAIRDIGSITQNVAQMNSAL